MCGITGIIDFTKKSSEDQIRLMTESIHSRGPDDVGRERFSVENCDVWLGFRRLSIIDLSQAGHQPMSSSDANCWIIFNGEIYNYKEIRKELEALGHGFISGSDTEVILNAYTQWGISCIEKFIGMFAFCLFDVKQNRLFLIRDRAGVKPLYYYSHNGLFLFGSELKCFHQHPGFRKEINPDALALYFQHGYVPAPYCIFKHAHKVSPGHFLQMDLKTGETTIKKYWDVVDCYNQPKLSVSFEDALIETERLLRSAFNYRMVSDVPVGVFLSGGYDSSCVAAILQSSNSSRIKTYTIGFAEKEYNEAEYAKAVATHLGTDHHEYYCTFREAIDIVPQLPEIFDEPFGDQSAIPTTLVSRIARQHVKVALSADGGDELFAGYPRHLKSLNMIRKLQWLPGFISFFARIFSVPPGTDLSRTDKVDKLREVLLSRNVVKKFGVINQTFTTREIRHLLTIGYKNVTTAFDDGERISDSNTTLDKILAVEYKAYLSDDILHKVDRATMSTGLEGREPFLDHRIIEFVSRLPSEFKLKDGRQKVLLKHLVHKYIPESIMNRPKMGFGIPLEQWCRQELKDTFETVLDTHKLNSQGIFDAKLVQKMKSSYLKSGHENFQRIWLIFVFQLWYSRWIGK